MTIKISASDMLINNAYSYTRGFVIGLALGVTAGAVAVAVKVISE